MLTHIVQHISECELSAYYWLSLIGVFLNHFRMNLHQTRMVKELLKSDRIPVLPGSMYLCLSDIRQVAALCSELRYFSIANNQYGLRMCSDCLSCVYTGLCVSKVVRPVDLPPKTPGSCLR